MSKPGFFERVGHFERKFQTEGASPTNHCCCRQIRVIALLCDIKISVVPCLVMSQSTCVADSRQTSGQYYDSLYHTSIAACAVKTDSSQGLPLYDVLAMEEHYVLICSSFAIFVLDKTSLPVGVVSLQPNLRPGISTMC